LAALNPNPKILKKLIESGGDITIFDDNGFGVFHYAAVGPDGPQFSKFALKNQDLGITSTTKETKQSDEEEEEEQSGKKRRKARSPSPRRKAVEAVAGPREIQLPTNLIEGCSPTLAYVLALYLQIIYSKIILQISG
jgi:hypothetical protein